MLVLAGVTINIVINRGLIGYAQDAKNKTAQAQEQEEIMLADVELVTDTLDGVIEKSDTALNILGKVAEGLSDVHEKLNRCDELATVILNNAYENRNEVVDELKDELKALDKMFETHMNGISAGVYQLKNSTAKIDVPTINLQTLNLKNIDLTTEAKIVEAKEKIYEAIEEISIMRAKEEAIIERIESLRNIKLAMNLAEDDKKINIYYNELTEFVIRINEKVLEATEIIYRDEIRCKQIIINEYIDYLNNDLKNLATENEITPETAIRLGLNNLNVLSLDSAITAESNVKTTVNNLLENSNVTYSTNEYYKRIAEVKMQMYSESYSLLEWANGVCEDSKGLLDAILNTLDEVEESSEEDVLSKQQEIIGLLNELDGLSSTSKYAGMRIFDGTFDYSSYPIELVDIVKNSTSANDLTNEQKEGIILSFPSLSAESLEIDDVSTSDISGSKSKINTATGTINEFMDDLDTMSAKLELWISVTEEYISNL